MKSTTIASAGQARSDESEPRLSFRGRRRRELGIQSSKQGALDSGFADKRPRPGMTTLQECLLPYENIPMTSATETSPLANAIDAVEDTYAYLLAYAGQGRGRDESGDDSVRDYLRRAEGALGFIATMTADGGGEERKAFVEMVRQDAARARTALRFVLAQKTIGSQIVDNLNASIHLRTLLTDLFLLDEALKISGL